MSESAPDADDPFDSGHIALMPPESLRERRRAELARIQDTYDWLEARADYQLAPRIMRDYPDPGELYDDKVAYFIERQAGLLYLQSQSDALNDRQVAFLVRFLGLDELPVVTTEVLQHEFQRRGAFVTALQQRIAQLNGGNRRPVRMYHSTLFSFAAVDDASPRAAATALRREEFRIFTLGETEHIRRSEQLRDRARSYSTDEQEALAVIGYVEHRAEIRMLRHYLHQDNDSPIERRHAALFLSLRPDAGWPEIEQVYEQRWEYLQPLRVADSYGCSLDAVRASQVTLAPHPNQLALPVPPSLFEAYRAYLRSREWDIPNEEL